MDLLERVKKIHGAEEALGITFAVMDVCDARLPGGSRLFGYTPSTYFCFVNGYQQTVFAVHDLPEQEWKAWPVAYDFREFLRLIFACGSAELAAASGIISENEYERRYQMEALRVNSGLTKLRSLLSLEPIENPYSYTHRVGQVIDHKHIARR